jgi:hypothetical protein
MMSDKLTVDLLLKAKEMLDNADVADGQCCYILTYRQAKSVGVSDERWAAAAFIDDGMHKAFYFLQERMQ